MRASKTLIRLGGCPGLSESLLGAHAIVLVLSAHIYSYILSVGIVLGMAKLTGIFGQGTPKVVEMFWG